MDELTELPLAISIKQPWVDLIFRGLKDIEVREWRVERRGPVLVHASNTIDWKTVELLAYDHASELPRGGLVGIAEIVDVIEFDRRTWLDLMLRHRIVHPPVREPIYGVVLGEVIPFRKRISCRGRLMFFPVPTSVESQVREELAS